MESTSNRALRAGYQVVEVLPGSRFLLLADADASATPGPDELGDLRYHARKLTRSPVLGVGIDEAFVVQAVITAVVSGVVSPAVWTPFPAARRWIERTIRRREALPAPVPPAQPQTPKPEEFNPVERAEEMVRKVLGNRPGPLAMDLVEVSGDGSLWKVALTVSGQWSAQVAMALDGTIAEIVVTAIPRRP
jgi:hypothetical protein